MDLTFTTSGNTASLKESLDKLREAVTPTVGMARQIGQTQIRIIRRRTALGIDLHGEAFTPYSPGYATSKLKRGGSGIVNLYSVEVGAHMLDELAVMVNGVASVFGDVYSTEPLDGEFGIGIYDDPVLEARLRSNNEGAERLPKREILGISEEELYAHEAEAGKYIEAALVKLL